MRTAASAALAALLLMTTAAQARLQEEQIDVPVEVTDAYGKVLRQAIKVTVFSDTANPMPAPVLVLNHGRSPEPQQRAALGRARYAEASRYFVKQGFIVAVPTRMGYGQTGGEDVEDTGICSKKNYAPGGSRPMPPKARRLSSCNSRRMAKTDTVCSRGFPTCGNPEWRSSWKRRASSHPL